MQPWEDALLERKVESDLKDLLKTVVAFANSVRPDHIATILIGERDDGTIEGVHNPDQIQITVRRDCDKVFPPVIWRSSVYEANGKPCVKIEIEYSGDTPHFGGPAWVRKGSETIKASDELFQQLISLRNNTVREIAKWTGKIISIEGEQSTTPQRAMTVAGQHIQVYDYRWPSKCEVELVLVNSFWATFKNAGGKLLSEPLDKLILSYDDENNRLKLIIRF